MTPFDLRHEYVDPVIMWPNGYVTKCYDEASAWRY